MGLTIRGGGGAGNNLFATCECMDFAYRHDPEQQDVDERLERAFSEVEIVSHVKTPYGSDVYVTETHCDPERCYSVEVSSGENVTDWYCKHILAVLVERLGVGSFVLIDEVEVEKYGLSLVRVDGYLWGIETNMEDNGDG